MLAKPHRFCNADEMIMANIELTSMLLPGDPGSIGIHIYVFTVESQQPVGATHISCTQLLWKHTARAGKTHPFT
jgi:hypothetical protein